MKAALIPFTPVLGDVSGNINRLAEAAEKTEGDILLFPELAASGYLLERLVRDAAVSPKDSLWDPIRQISRTKEIVIGAAVRQSHCYYNASLVFSAGELVFLHKKIYLPTYGMFDEARYFCSGESLPVYNGVLGKTGILICEDAWHPALAYAVYAAGAEHVLVPSASPARGFSQERTGILSSRKSWKNRLEVYAESFAQQYHYVNLNTVEDGVTFGGESFTVLPGGGLREESPGDPFIYDIIPEDFSRAAQRGGPWQDEQFQLNLRLFNDADISRREKEKP